MAELQTLVADTTRRPPEATLPAPYEMRPCHRSDTQALGTVYFEAYDPGKACPTLEEAVADIRASFDGEYGKLWTAASPVALAGADLVGAVLTVWRSPWNDTPDCPFVIELFTARQHRRAGLARALLTSALTEAHRHGQDGIALRVEADNTAALGLYSSLGFRQE